MYRIDHCVAGCMTGYLLGKVSPTEAKEAKEVPTAKPDVYTSPKVLPSLLDY